MPKRYLFLIIALVGITFCNSLFNGFVGDDEVMLVKNDFYSSWDHLPLLISEHYIADSRDYFFNKTAYHSSGAVSYRPVNSLSYFFDRAAWDLSPFGYHLHNLLLHILNSGLVFLLVWMILRQRSLAFWSALFFGVHPLAAEAVCAISYRHDLQACFFSLLAMIFFILYRTRKRRLFYGVSLLSYALAIFSKESAVLLPFVLIAYDYYYEQVNSWSKWTHHAGPLLGMLIMTGLYLIVYLFVFPNSAVANNPLLGGNLGLHSIYTVTFLGNYLTWFLLPFSVNPLPGLYNPTLEPWGLRQPGQLLVAGLLLVLAIRKRKDRDFLFFVLMFVLFYLPASNIIPLANPVAHRFMYLPMVGLSVALMVLIDQLGFPQLRFDLKRLVRIVLVAGGILTSFTISAAWKNNLTLAHSWVQDYPRHAKGHSIMGIEYYKRGACEQAEPALQQAINLGDRDPRLFFLLGKCAILDDARAAALFLQAVRQAPDYAAPYRGLGQIAERRGKYAEAITYFQKSLTLQPTVGAYRSILRCLQRLGRPEEAPDWLQRARGDLNPDEYQLLIDQSNQPAESRQTRQP